MYYNFKTEGSGAKAYYLGDYASRAQIDIASKYPDYAGLTADNFIIQNKAGSTSYSGNRVGYHRFENGLDPGEKADISIAGSASVSAPSISYNSSTGKLSFSISLAGSSSAGIWDRTNEASYNGSTTVTAKVYLVTDIENL